MIQDLCSATDSRQLLAGDALIDSIENLWHFGCTTSCSSNNNSENGIISNDDDHINTIKNQQHNGKSIRVKQRRLSAQRSNKIKGLKALFNLLDDNGDGFVSIDAISALLEKVGCAENCRVAIAETLITEANIQIDRSKVPINQLDLEQFKKLYDSIMRPSTVSIVDDTNGIGDDELHNNLYQDGLLDEAFKVYDRNGDGFISASELESVLSELGLLRMESFDGSKIRYCQDLIDKVDKNGDGLVDLDEFKNMMLIAH